MLAENLKRWVADRPAMKPTHPQRGICMPDLALAGAEVDNLVDLETLK